MATTTPQQAHPSNVVIGAGWIYISPLDDDGNLSGWEYVGDSTGMTITIDEERTTVYSGDGARAQKLIDKVTQRSFRATATIRDMTAANFARLLQGETKTVPADVKGKVDEEQIADVRQGRWYQLGATAADPSGVLAVEDDATFAVKKGATAAAANTAAAAGTDYRLDADRGMVYIVPGGGIADGNGLKVTYNRAGNKRERAQTKSPPEDVYVGVRYDEDGPDKRRAIIRRASLGSAGDFQLKSGDRQTPQEFTLTMGVEEPGGDAPAVQVDGKPL